MKRIFNCFVFLFVLIAFSYLQAGEFPKYMFADPYWIYSIAYDPDMTQPMIDSSYYYPQLARLGITHSSTYGDNTSLNNVENIKLFNNNIEKAKYVSGTYIKVKDYTTGQNRDYRVGNTDNPSFDLSYFDYPETGDDIRDGVNGPHVYCALVSQDDVGNLLPLANLGIWRFSREFKFIFRMKMVGDNTSHDPVAEVHIWEDYQILKGSGAEETEEESHQIFSADIESKVGTTPTDETYIIYSDDFDASGVYQKIESPNISLHYKVEFGGVKRTVRTYITLKWLKNRDLYIDHLWTRDIYNYRIVEALDRITWHNKILDYLRPIHNYNPSNNFRWYSDEPRSYMYDSFNKVDDLSRNDPTIGIPLNGATGGGDYAKFSAFISKIQPDELIANRYTITGEHSSSSDVAYENSIQNAFDVYTNNIGDAALACKQYDTDLWPMIQVQSEYRYYEDSDEWRWFYRDPSKNEIKAQVNLSLCYGAKGISYFVYGTGNFGWGTYYYHGLVDNVGGSPVYDPTSGDYLPSLYDYTTGVYEPNEKWYAVQEAHEIIDLIADDLLSLDWQNAFTYPGDAVPTNSAVLSVENTSGLNEYVEIGNFVHSVTGDKYFMLVNRRVQDDNPNDAQTLTVNLESSGATRLMEDVIASRKPWDGDQNRVAYRVLNSGENTFIVALEPGECRLFRISSGLSGTISMDSYWSGEVLIADNITVNDNISLKIYQGTIVKFNSGKKINVNGTLDAQGTNDNHILFTSISATPSRGDWYGIRFEDSSIDANCIVKYCDIKYATYGVYCNRANPKIQNSSISHCNYGIYLYYSSPAYIETNSITNNGTGIYGVSSSPTITDNLLRDNSYAGIYFSGGSPKLYDNTIDENSMGAYIISGSSPKFGPTSGSGKGNNVITENSYGIYAQYYSDLFMGSHGYYPGARIGGYNSICDNSVIDATAYFYTDIEAEYNWWGTSPVRLACYGSSINYSFALGSDPGGGSSLGKTLILAGNNAGEVNKDKWAGFDPNNPDINSLSDLWLWGHYLFINDKLEDAIEVYKMLVNKFSGDNYANRSLVKIYHLYHETGKDGLADYLNALLNNSKINKNVHQIIYPLLMNAYLDDKDINSALNIGETIMKKYPDSITEKTAIYNMVLAMLNDLNDIEKASKYTEVLKQKYPDDELTYMAREAMGEKVDWSLAKRGYFPKPEVFEPEIPEKFALGNNYPNPFNPMTTIEYDLPEESHVTLIIYDISGREIVKLVDGNLNEGFRHAIWDGKDKSGNQVSSGVYLYSIRTSSGFNATKKMVLVR